MQKFIFNILFLLFFSGLRAQDATAQQYFANNQYSEAIEVWRKMLKAESANRADIYYNMATAYAKMQKYPQAILLFERCLKYNYNHSGAHLNLAIARAKHRVDIGYEPPFFEHFAKKIVYTVSLFVWQILAIFCSWFFLVLYFYGKRNTASSIQILKNSFLILSLFFLLIAMGQKYYSQSDNYAIASPNTSWYSDASMKKSAANAKGGEKVELLDIIDKNIQFKTAKDSIFWAYSKDLIHI